MKKRRRSPLKGEAETDPKGLESHAKGSWTIFPGNWRDLREGGYGYVCI